MLKQQIIVLRRGKPIRMLFFGCRRGRSGLGLPPVSEGPRRARHIVRPDTVVRWHRAVSDCFGRLGRPAVPRDPTINPCPRLHIRVGVLGCL